MPSLLEVQQGMHRHLFAAVDGSAGADAHTDEPAGALAAAAAAPGPVPGLGAASLPCLAVYRDTCRGALLNALRLSYPAVRRLVGEEFFEGAVQYFIESGAGAPGSAWLYEYGGGFADFLASFPPAGGLPYLAEVARIEWAVNVALHAPDAPPGAADAAPGGPDAAMPAPDADTALPRPGLPMAQAGDCADTRVVPHPSTSLLALQYPSDAIWRAVLEEDDAALAAVDLSCGPVRLLVERTDSGLQVLRLTQQAWQLAQRLCTAAAQS